MLKQLLILMFTMLTLQSVSAQNGTADLVPIVAEKDTIMQQWELTELKNIQATVRFPESPKATSKDIYSDKGLIPEYIYKWEKYDGTILLQASVHGLNEWVTLKNEKKLADAEAQRLAIVFAGYPQLGTPQDSPEGRFFPLEMTTTQKSKLKARIYLNKSVAIILFAHILSDENTSTAEAFLSSLKNTDKAPENITTQAPLNEPIKKVDEKIVKPQELKPKDWEWLQTEFFGVGFPLAPVAKHFRVENAEVAYNVYSWYAADKDRVNTYLVSLSALPTENKAGDAREKYILEGIKKSLQITDGELVRKRNIKAFRYPATEVLFKTKQQYFRVRYFTDGDKFYQLVVSGNAASVFNESANRFLDGIQWP